jgi:hypothetical protein
MPRGCRARGAVAKHRLFADGPVRVVVILRQCFAGVRQELWPRRAASPRTGA